ncbi:putative protein OS=Streptomyces microflavus OX=1919 GN=G3I39_16760 PE=4 SV=1 [Streptomyces microflavus]
MLIRATTRSVEPPRLLAQAQRLADIDAGPGADGYTGAVVGTSVHSALGVLFGSTNRTRSPPGTRSSAWRRATYLWVSAAEALPEAGVAGAPFEDADPELVVCRFDVSAVFDEEELDEELDEPAAGRA